MIAIIPIANAWDPSLPFEDAYISFAYALHLATGHGLVLSVGAPSVEAFSNPLWVLILATGKLLGFTIPTWSNVVNVVLVGILAGTTMRIARRLASAAPIWIVAGAAITVALLPVVAYYAVAGLETLLFAVVFNLALLWFLTDCNRSNPISGTTEIWFLLLALVRPEGFLIWVVAWTLSWQWSRIPKLQLMSACWFAIPAGVLELLRLGYFHQLVPNSVVEKLGRSWSQSAPLDKSELLRFWHQYPLIIVVGIGVFVACLVGRALIPSFRPIVIIIVVTFAFEAISASGDNYPEERYLFFALPAVLAASVSAISQIGWPESTRDTVPAQTSRRALLRYASAACAIALEAVTLLIAFDNREPSATLANDLNVTRGFSRIPNLFRPDLLSEHSGGYQFSLAKFLKKTQPPGSIVAMDEIGIASYYAGMHVIDLQGLADSHISHLPGGPGNRVDPKYLFGLRPRAIVLTVTGCLCIGVPSGMDYAQNVQMFGYTLHDVPYDSTGPPAALLFERDRDASSIVSLDATIPKSDRQITALPFALGTVLDSQFPLDPRSKVVAPTPEQRAAGVLGSRHSYVAVAAGSTVQLPIVRTAGNCSVHLTGVSPGSPSNQQLTATISDAGGSQLAATAISLWTAPDVQTATLSWPTNASGPQRLTLSGTSAAEWAEPFTTCRGR
jgi:hypothetical protein